MECDFLRVINSLHPLFMKYLTADYNNFFQHIKLPSPSWSYYDYNTFFQQVCSYEPITKTTTKHTRQMFYFNRENIRTNE